MMFSCPFMICFEVSAISYFKLTHLENIKSYIFLKWPSLVCFQSANFIFVLFKQQFTGKMCRPFINKNSYLKLRIKKFLWRTGALALQCWWWLMFERLWVGIPAPYTEWTWHFSHWVVEKIEFFVWNDWKCTKKRPGSAHFLILDPTEDFKKPIKIYGTLEIVTIVFNVVIFLRIRIFKHFGKKIKNESSSRNSSNIKYLIFYIYRVKGSAHFFALKIMVKYCLLSR